MIVSLIDTERVYTQLDEIKSDEKNIQPPAALDDGLTQFLSPDTVSHIH